MDDDRTVHDDWHLALQLLHALLTALTLAGSVYLYISDRARAHRTELEGLRQAHEERLRKLESGASRVDARMEAMPSAAAVAQMNATLAGLTAQVEGARESMRAISLRFDRVEDYLAAMTARGRGASA